MMASLSQDGQSSGLNMAVGFDPMCSLGQVVNDSPRPVTEVEEDLFPCILAMCGSGFGFFQVNKDGTFKVVDSSNRGGRAFSGLGSLLTGVKDYKELIDLASKGNQQNVDMFNNALFGNQEAAGGEDSLYSRSAELQHPNIVYCFGKCVGANRDDFKREDIAHALLNHYVLDLTQTLSLIGTNAGVGRVVFCGSFVNEPFVRSMITEELVKRNMFCMMFGKGIVKFDFIRPGPHLGAIGALVTQYEQQHEAGGAKA